MEKQVVLVKHNPDWVNNFSEEKILLIPLFRNNFISIHHIGSTSIPEIYAKPIIDMLAVVKDIEKVNGLNDNFIGAGYTPRGEFGIPGRRYFVKSLERKNRTHHLHVFAKSDEENILRHISFRDYLMSFPDSAKEYSELKISLAKKFAFDGNSYQDGKESFIKKIQKQAIEWFKEKKNLRTSNGV